MAPLFLFVRNIDGMVYYSIIVTAKNLTIQRWIDDSLVILDVVRSDLLFFVLYIIIKIGKNRC